MTNNISEEFEILQKPYLHLPSEEIDFNPAIWNHSDIIDATGDYAYVLNLPLLGEAKIGTIFQRAFMDEHNSTARRAPVVTSTELENRLDKDGMFYLGNDIEKCLPQTGHVIAFFARPTDAEKPKELVTYDDTLKLRRDSNGNWSYRVRAGCPTPSVPTQKDWAGKTITNLQKANLGPYSHFVGYATLPYDGLVYHPRLKLSDHLLQPFAVKNPAKKPDERIFTL
jgi:hypothetical protein